MDWFKKHVDTALVLGSILGSFLWMNGKINDIEKDIVVVKTVLVMHKIMPQELAVNEERNRDK